VAALQLLGKRHPHVISILDALQNDTHLFCVFPYMPGALSTCLIDGMASSPTGRISEYQARRWFRQILCSISQLQKKGICHRDLCIDNMVVDENKNIHIIDLGLCLRVPFTDPNNRMCVADVSANTCRRLMKAQGQCGLWQYMAPEVRSRSEFLDGFAIDLWSAGIVLFEFLVGMKPFAFPDPADRNFKSISDEGNLGRLVLKRGAQLSDGAVDLLQNMLWHDPAKRLTLEEVVKHPWVQGRGEMSVSSIEGDGLHNWLIQTESIDDLDDAKPAKLLLAGLQDSYHSESTSGTMNSSDDTMEVDAESDNCSQPHEPPARNCSGRSSLQPLPDALDSIEEEDVDTRRHKEPRRSWGCCFPTKKLKWRRALKATTSLPAAAPHMVWRM
jgi:serine/threonine protein kinase